MTVVHLAFGQLTVLPPRWEKRCGQDLLGLWAIQVWEEQTPAGEEPLEWLLLTSLSTATLDQAWERVNWSAHRWVVEEYHQCLKTGCRLEERQVQSAARLMRLLGLLSPLAVRLLQLRDLSRKAPECSAPPGPRSRFARRCCRIDWSDSWLENALERLAVCPDAA